MNKILITNENEEINGFFEGTLCKDSIIYMDESKEIVIFDGGMHIEETKISIHQDDNVFVGFFEIKEFVEHVSDEMIINADLVSLFELSEEPNEVFEFFSSKYEINDQLVKTFYDQFSEVVFCEKMLKIFSLLKKPKQEFFFEVILNPTLHDMKGALNIVQESKNLGFGCSISSEEEKISLKVFLEDFYLINKFSFIVFNFLLKGEFEPSNKGGFFVPSWENYNSRIFINEKFSEIFPQSNSVTKVYKCLEFIYLGEENALNYIFGDNSV